MQSLSTTSYNNGNKLVYSLTKKYPDYSKIYLYYEGKSLRKDYKVKSGHRQNFTTEKQNIIDSLRRTKTTISDIVECNKFNYFATFTFNCQSCPEKCKNNPCICSKNKCHRLNPDKCKQKMSTWLNNQSKQNIKIKYIIVGEWHKAGGLHFHAMIKDYPLEKLVPATNPRTGKQIADKGNLVYNIKSYKLGHSTLKIIGNTEDDHAFVARYIKKYITKSMPEFKGKKRYWCSTGLIRPVTTTDDDLLENPYIKKRPLYHTESFKILRAEIQNNLQQLPNDSRLKLLLTNHKD